MSTDFPYVHVNLDGSARELSPEERDYLTTAFEPGDGARPYVKSSYDSLTPAGFMSGYMRRAQLPPGLNVQPVNPQYDALVAELRPSYPEHSEQQSRRVGDVVIRNPDGSVTHSPNPNLSQQERWERWLQVQREDQLEMESWAAFPHES